MNNLETWFGIMIATVSALVAGVSMRMADAWRKRYFEIDARQFKHLEGLFKLATLATYQDEAARQLLKLVAVYVEAVEPVSLEWQQNRRELLARIREYLEQSETTQQIREFFGEAVAPSIDRNRQSGELTNGEDEK